MENNRLFYIDGVWVAPATVRELDVINPATEELAGTVSLGSMEDVEKAVAAAKAAFPSFSTSDRQYRIGLLRRIVDLFDDRIEEVARTITLEMGSPIGFSRAVQARRSKERFSQAADVLAEYPLEMMVGGSRIVREPIGVCGFITPWNWPLNQIASKVAYAIAAGCTMVWKPSEVAPLSAVLLAEIIDQAGVPKGVFNMVQGEGADVGAAIASHPDIDMVSFTGSTRAGVAVAKAAAETVKRVHQELGGKSANIILPDADLGVAVAEGVDLCFKNTGQSCQAPTRMLVHESQLERAVELAAEAAAAVRVGDPLEAGTSMGPLASAPQFEKVQDLIARGIEEGARLVCGGTGRPEGFNRGYYVRPTVFADVTNDMAIAREEIFGPVLCMLSYRNEDEAVEIANDSEYGLAGYVASSDLGHAREIAARIRAGRVYLNHAPARGDVPFGGYKRSGNGREQGVFGFEDFLEVKAILGYDPIT